MGVDFENWLLLNTSFSTDVVQDWDKMSDDENNILFVLILSEYKNAVYFEGRPAYGGFPAQTAYGFLKKNGRIIPPQFTLHIEVKSDIKYKKEIYEQFRNKYNNLSNENWWLLIGNKSEKEKIIESDISNYKVFGNAIYPEEETEILLTGD